MIAMRIAARNPAIKACALLAPSAMPLNELAVWQVQRRLSQQGAQPDEWKNDPVVTTFDEARDSDERWTVVAMKPVDLNVFRELINTAPQQQVTKIRVPMFIAAAGRDAQMPPGQGQTLATAARNGGNASVRYKLFAELDHFFRRGTGSISDYSDETRSIDREFLDALGDWLREALK